MKKRLLSLFCALALCLSLLPGTAWAAEEWTYSSGTPAKISDGETTLTVTRSNQNLTITGVSTLASLGVLVLPTEAKNVDGGDTYTVIDIGAGAFMDCSGLTSVTVPDRITIDSTAFANCTNLTSATLPSDLTAIPQSLFAGCTSLTDIALPEKITSIGNYAFQNCTSLTSITVPSGVTSIGSDAFYGCTSLERIELPESMTSIGAYAFQNCTSLTDITLPENITKIDSATFRDCTSLTSITVPGAVTVIGYYAFYGCTSLKEMTVLAATPPTLDSAAFGNATSNSLTAIYVPAESVDAYKGADVWQNFADKIKAIVEESMTLTPDSASWEGKYGTDFDLKEFTITNEGEDALTNISVTLDTTGEDNFTLDTAGMANSLSANADTTFTVTPKADLGVGTYNATVTVTAAVGDETETKTADLTCTVNAKSLENAQVQVSGEYTYDGNAKEPSGNAVTVTLDGKTLIENTDYTLSYSNNTDAGKATVTATGKGNYSGTATGTFQIAKAAPAYTVPTSLTATYGDTLADVALPDDWAWDDAVTTSVGNVGDNTFSATFTPSDTTNYNTVNEDLTVTVSAKDITGAEITLGDNLTYTGQEQTQQITSVTVDGLTVTYDVTGNTGTDADTYTLTISGTGNFTGEATQKWSIAKATYTGTTDVSGTVLANWSDKVTLPAIPDGASYGAASYDGSDGAVKDLSIEGGVLSYTGGSGVTKGREYKITVPVDGGKNYEDYTITVTLTGTDKKELTITGVTDQDGTYNGQPYQGYTGTPSAEGFTGDFTVTYNTTDGKAPTNAGIYSVTIAIPEDDAQYVGSIVLEFAIAKKPLTVSAPSASVYVGDSAPKLALTYTGLVDGESVTPSEAPAFTITKSDGTEIALADAVKTADTYTITWSNADGTTFTGADNYDITLKNTGTLTVTTRPSSSGGTTTPSGPSTGGSDGWTEIEDEVDETPSGSTVTVDMNGTTEVPAEVFEAVAGKDVTLELDMGGGVKWEINGQDIPTDLDFTDLDMGVSLNTSDIPVDVINMVTGEKSTVQLSLAHDGEFGFTLTLTAPLGVENKGLWANLYHYNTTQKQMLFETAAQVDASGNVALKFTHASEYAIVLDESSHELPFTDTAKGAWYQGAVEYVYRNSIMTGTSATSFEPNAPLSRAMVAQILYNLEGQPTVEGESTFADASGHWAVNAIAWAQQTGVVNGYEDNTFRPNRAVSREELAQMLYNYAKVKGYDLTASGDLTAFPDGSKVSSWAEAAMAWANGNELINGHDDGTLQPGGDSTRAQAASILMSFDLNLAN